MVQWSNCMWVTLCRLRRLVWCVCPFKCYLTRIFWKYCNHISRLTFGTYQGCTACDTPDTPYNCCKSSNKQWHAGKSLNVLHVSIETEEEAGPSEKAQPGIPSCGLLQLSTSRIHLHVILISSLIIYNSCVWTFSCAVAFIIVNASALWTLCLVAKIFLSLTKICIWLPQSKKVQKDACTVGCASQTFLHIW